MNIMILAAGTRNKVVQAFREAFRGEGTVVGGRQPPGPRHLRRR